MVHTLFAVGSVVCSCFFGIFIGTLCAIAMEGRSPLMKVILIIGSIALVAVVAWNIPGVAAEWANYFDPQTITDLRGVI